MNQKRNLCIILVILIVCVLVAIAVVKNINQPRSSTIKVGSSEFQQDPRTYPEYKADSGYKVAILNPGSLGTDLSEVAKDRLAANLKTKAYEKTGSIPAVASIVDPAKSESDGQMIGFSIQFDNSAAVYRVVAKTDGTITSMEVK